MAGAAGALGGVDGAEKYLDAAEGRLTEAPNDSDKLVARLSKKWKL